jgi:hypothetical protein
VGSADIYTQIKCIYKPGATEDIAGNAKQYLGAGLEEVWRRRRRRRMRRRKRRRRGPADS